MFQTKKAKIIVSWKITNPTKISEKRSCCLNPSFGDLWPESYLSSNLSFPAFPTAVQNYTEEAAALYVMQEFELFFIGNGPMTSKRK